MEFVVVVRMFHLIRMVATKAMRVSLHRCTRVTFLCFNLAITLAPCTALSQAFIHAQSELSIHLQIGDSIQSVRQALSVSDAPVHTLGGDKPLAGEIRLRERGIWVFFNGLGQARQFRFDAPFSGDIHGAKIGASIEQIQELLGSPVRELPGWSKTPGNEAYLYRVDPEMMIRCDFEQYRLATIRVLMGAVTLGGLESKGGGGPGAHQQIAPVQTQQKATGDLVVPESPAVRRQSTMGISAHSQAADQPRVTEGHQRIAPGLQAAGQLAATHDLGCISVEKARSIYTAADLYRSTRQCLDADQYALAAPLLALAGAYGRFDAMRVADSTAGQGIAILTMNVGDGLTGSQKQEFLAAVKQLHDNPEKHAGLCAHIARIGPPNYIPVYLIVHGIGLRGNERSDANGLDPDFDSAKTWSRILSEGLLCS